MCLLEPRKSRTIEGNTGRAERHRDSPPLLPSFSLLLLRCQSRRRAERSHAQPGSFTSFASIQSCSLSRQVQRGEEVRTPPKTAAADSPGAERSAGSSSLSGLNWVFTLSGFSRVGDEIQLHAGQERSFTAEQRECLQPACVFFLICISCECVCVFVCVFWRENCRWRGYTYAFYGRCEAEFLKAKSDVRLKM